MAKLSNIIIPIYAGVAVAILWEEAFGETWEASPIGLRKIFLSVILALALILPFQRLSWYENFIDSKSEKESKKSLLSIGISVAVAVAGVL